MVCCGNSFRSPLLRRPSVVFLANFGLGRKWPVWLFRIYLTGMASWDPPSCVGLDLPACLKPTSFGYQLWFTLTCRSGQMWRSVFSTLFEPKKHFTWGTFQNSGWLVTKEILDSTYHAHFIVTAASRVKRINPSMPEILSDERLKMLDVERNCGFPAKQTNKTGCAYWKATGTEVQIKSFLSFMPVVCVCFRCSPQGKKHTIVLKEHLTSGSKQSVQSFLVQSRPCGALVYWRNNGMKSVAYRWDCLVKNASRKCCRKEMEGFQIRGDLLSTTVHLFSVYPG